MGGLSSSLPKVPWVLPYGQTAEPERIPVSPELKSGISDTVETNTEGIKHYFMGEIVKNVNIIWQCDK